MLHIPVLWTQVDLSLQTDKTSETYQDLILDSHGLILTHMINMGNMELFHTECDLFQDG